MFVAASTYRCVPDYSEVRDVGMKTMLDHADLDMVKIVYTDKVSLKGSAVIFAETTSLCRGDGR